MPEPAAPQPVVLTEGQKRLLDLGNTLWNEQTPAGIAFREAARAKYPEVQTPESQLEPVVAPLKAQFDELMKKLSDRDDAERKRDEEREQREAERTLAQRTSDARNEFRLTDQGYEMMVKRMQDTGNYTDPHAAAAYIVSANPPPRDITGLLGPQNKVNLFGQGQDASDERMKKLLSDPMGAFLDAEFTDFLVDPDQYIRDAGIAA